MLCRSAPLFRGVSIVPAVSRCSGAVPLFHRSGAVLCSGVPALFRRSAGVPCSVVPCSGVPGFIVCLNKSHRIQHCKVKYACAKCLCKRHNVSICEKVKQDKEIKNEDNNEAPPTENVVMQLNSNSQSILLQTAKAKIFNCDENRKLPVEFCLTRVGSIPTAQII